MLVAKKANAGNVYLATGLASVKYVNFSLWAAFNSIDALFVYNRLVVRMALHFGRSAAISHHP